MRDIRVGDGSRLAALSAGSVAGVISVVVVLSLASLMFSGPLAVALPLISILMLGAAAAMNVILARRGSLPGSVMIPQDATSAVLAAALATVVVGLPSDVAVSTACAIVAVASAATAVVMLVLGGFRLGSLVRYIPYPVMGGFLAGTGVLLLTGAVDLMSDGFAWTSVTTGSVILGLILGATILFVTSRDMHALALPGLIVSAIVAFYLALWLSGVSIPEARTMGLLGSASEGLGVPEIAFGGIDWSAVVAGIPVILTVPIVAVVSLLLNVGGLELVADREADLDGELRAAGVANLAAAVGAASAGYHAISLTTLGYRVGVRSRMVTVTVAGVCLVGAAVGPVLVSFLPIPVIGSILAMLGFSFLWDWVVTGHRRMTQIEYLLMLVICLGLVVLGFLIGIAFGLAAAVLLFAATYSRLDPVRHMFTASERRSSVERSAPVREFLNREGAAVLVFELEGYLFFGTAHTAARTVLAAVEPGVTRMVVVDLRRVQGIDSTAVLALSKLRRDLVEHDVALVVSNPSPETALSMYRVGLDESTRVVHVTDIDHALEHAESLLLEDVEDGPSNPWLLADDLWRRLVSHMDRIDVRAGQVLADVGEHAQSVFIVESGRVAADLPVGDRWQRLRVAGPGGVLGEMSMYGDGHRSARLWVEESGIVLRLSPEGVRDLEASDPECAIAFHRAAARVLSERLVTSNDFIRALAR